MKRTILVAFLAVALVTVSVQAQTAEEIVSNYVQAVAGSNSFENINSMKMVMSGEFAGMDSGQMAAMMQGREMEYTMYSMKPNKFRMEMKIGPMSMTMGSDGSDSWMSMMGRTMDMPSTGQGGNGFNQMTAMYTGDYMSHMEGASYNGTETFNGVACHAVNVTQEGQPSTLYFSTDSNLLQGVRMSSEGNDMMMTVSDYRDVEGFKMPFQFNLMMNGEEMMKMSIKEMEINPAVDASMFARP